MLLQRERFADFTNKPLADGSTHRGIAGVSAESREDVDELADKALAAGATPANEPMDHGFMYGRSFNDPDGHLWEVIWMSQEAAEQARPTWRSRRPGATGRPVRIELGRGTGGA